MNISKNQAFLSTLISYLPIHIILSLSKEIRDKVTYDENQKLNGKLTINVNKITNVELIDFCLNFKRYNSVNLIIDDVNQTFNDCLYYILAKVNKKLTIHWNLSEFNKANFELAAKNILDKGFCKAINRINFDVNTLSMNRNAITTMEISIEFLQLQVNQMIIENSTDDHLFDPINLQIDFSISLSNYENEQFISPITHKMVFKHIACFKQESHLLKHLQLLQTDTTNDNKLSINIQIYNEMNIKTLCKLLDVNQFILVDLQIKTLIIECDDSAIQEPNCGLQDKNGTMLSLAYEDENYIQYEWDSANDKQSDYMLSVNFQDIKYI